MTVLTVFIDHAEDRAKRLAAIQAQADSLPYDEVCAQLQALHLEERAEHNAEWMAIAADKAAHLREQRDATVRLAEAKRHLREAENQVAAAEARLRMAGKDVADTEAENQVAAAEARLRMAVKDVADTEAEVKRTNATIAALGREIELEYCQLASHHPRPCYEYYVQWLRTHPKPQQLAPAPAPDAEPAAEEAAEETTAEEPKEELPPAPAVVAVEA